MPAVQGLKDKDWLKRQDPYAVLLVGPQRLRSRTAHGGGRNPVWNQQVSFNVVSDNTLMVELFDEDAMSRDDPLGTAVIDLSRVREIPRAWHKEPCFKHYSPNKLRRVMLLQSGDRPPPLQPFAHSHILLPHGHTLAGAGRWQ
jgi:hypothetical protein